MTRTVLAQELRTRRGAVLMLAGALSVLVFGALGAGSAMQSTIDDLSVGFPEALTAFIPSGGPGGYVVGEVFNLIAPLALVGYGVLAGASLVAGEEEEGTMAVLSSFPVSRRSLLLAKVSGLALTLLGVTAVFAIVVVLASQVFTIGLSTTHVLSACTHLLALALCFAVTSAAIGAITGHASVASGSAGAVAALTYVANAMLPLAGLDGLARLSPWHYYASSEPLVHGVDPTHLAVLVGLTLLATLTALVGFERRDLRG